MFMKKLSEIRKIRKSAGATLLLIAFGVLGNMPAVFAHGGEDHGESKPKTAADVKGVVSRTARIGDLEIMVKHSAIEPDTASTGRLFVTDFQTNAPADKIKPTAEVESANGTVTPIMVEKTDSAGSYNLKIPALPGGTYTLRAKVTYADETDTATFSGVQVETSHAASEGGIASRGGTALIALFSLVILGSFGGLIYYAVRAARGGRARREAVSA
jgi:hypothetical protein